MSWPGGDQKKGLRTMPGSPLLFTSGSEVSCSNPRLSVPLIRVEWGAVSRGEWRKGSRSSDRRVERDPPPGATVEREAVPPYSLPRWVEAKVPFLQGGNEEWNFQMTSTVSFQSLAGALATKRGFEL
jgi:hypothetical protein